MAATLQERLQKLGLATKDTVKPNPQASIAPPKWKQELDQYKQQQEEVNNLQSHFDDFSQCKTTSRGPKRVQVHPPTSPTQTKSVITALTSVDSSGPPDSDTVGDDILFLPKGRRKATYNRSANDDEDHDSELEEEPASSSIELAGKFCLFLQVIKFPYKYLEDADSKVSARYFSAGKIFKRAWNLHCIVVPEAMGGKPMFLAPYEQVQSLIDQINNDLTLHIEIPPYPFTMSFYNDGTPQPELLGIVNSKHEYDELRSSTVRTDSTAFSTTVREDDRLSWQEKIERALAMESKKKISAKRRNRERHLKLAVESCDQLKRLQRYFGLRPQLPTTSVIKPLSSNGKHEQKVLEDLDLLPAALDVGKCVDRPFEDSTVMLTIDVELWEQCHSMITEVGISTLDTADLVNIAPGQEGENWIEKIRSRHFRISGRENLRNTKYCVGDPENFKFGESEFVDIQAAPSLVDSCFEWPFSVKSTECASSPNTEETVITPNGKTNDNAEHRRNLLLIGHDITGDIDYLAQLGSEIFSTSSNPSHSYMGATPSRRQRVLSSIRECLDTASLYKTLTHDTNIRSLSKICYDLGFTAWHAHNAGNDARYTLEAFVKLAIRARQQDDARNALAKEKGNLNVRDTLWEIESEMTVQAKLQAKREAIKVALQNGGGAGNNATEVPRRSPSPFFAPEGSTEYPDKITLAEANRRYLSQWDGSLSPETSSAANNGQDI